MLITNKCIVHSTFILCLVVLFRDVTTSRSNQRKNDNNFEINGYYLDDMLTYSPARLGVYLNSSSDNFTVFAAEAHRPQELQCPSMNVISTRYRCKV